MAIARKPTFDVAANRPGERAVSAHSLHHCVPWRLNARTSDIRILPGAKQAKTRMTSEKGQAKQDWLRNRGNEL